MEFERLQCLVCQSLTTLFRWGSAYSFRIANYSNCGKVSINLIGCLGQLCKLTRLMDLYGNQTH